MLALWKSNESTTYTLPPGVAKSVRLCFVNQVKLEWMVVLRLRSFRNSVSDQIQSVAQWRRLDDFSLGLELIKELLTHLYFVILRLSLSQRLSCHKGWEMRQGLMVAYSSSFRIDMS